MRDIEILYDYKAFYDVTDLVVETENKRRHWIDAISYRDAEYCRVESGEGRRTPRRAAPKSRGAARNRRLNETGRSY